MAVRLLRKVCSWAVMLTAVAPIFVATELLNRLLFVALVAADWLDGDTLLGFHCPEEWKP